MGEAAKKFEITYNMEPTIQKFHDSCAFYRGIMGPVGSGKSTGCCMELFMIASGQNVGPFGLRRSRLAVIRNTYRELLDTTVKTWLDWFPEEEFGPFNYQHMTHWLLINDIECEVLFRALDRPSDVKKVLSLELTAAWINEAREVPKGIIDALGDRVGRFPAVKDGGCEEAGVLMDTNPPDEDHWWYRLSEEQRPDNWEFWTQPGGLIEKEGKFLPNPEAENIQNLPKDYYVVRLGGKDPAYVKVYYCAQYGFVVDGKPVHPDYVDAVHCSKEILKPMKGVPIGVGIDFGLTPAAVFGQQLPSGRYIWIDELVTEDTDTTQFAEILNKKINRDYPNFEFEFWGDPAGDNRAETDKRTPFKILKAAGIKARAANSNDPILRRGAVSGPLKRLVDGKPGLLISPLCKITRKGMAGGFCYKRIRIAGDERYQDKPDKNRFSHPVEAGEYLQVGFGEGKAQIKHKEDVAYKDAEKEAFNALNAHNPNNWMSQ